MDLQMYQNIMELSNNAFVILCLIEKITVLTHSRNM